MRRPGDLYLFLRAPQIGGVKRRLAADIGTLAAWRFYRTASGALIRRLAADPRWRMWLAVTPDRFAVRGRFWPHGLARTPQGRGDLGDRMARALCRIPHRAAVVVGSDIPEIDAHHVAQAFARLRAADIVVGPSADGGYWLIGARNARRDRASFGHVRWSTPHALADTLAGLRRDRSVVRLATLEDIDDEAAFARWRERRRQGRGGDAEPAQVSAGSRSRSRGISSTKLHGL